MQKFVLARDSPQAALWLAQKAKMPAGVGTSADRSLEQSIKRVGARPAGQSPQGLLARCVAWLLACLRQ